MSGPGFERLEDVIADEAFPELDLALRRGRHVDRDDGPWYTLLVEAEPLLVAFYRRYDAELIHRSDGYFFLLPTSDRLGRRHLSVADMLVGQALTLLYLDPATVQHGGVVDRDQLLGQLATTLGTDALVRALNPKRRRYDERMAEQTARAKVQEAVRRLSTLGFVELLGDGRLRLRPALLRFAEPVRGKADPEAELSRLVAAGEVALAPDDADAADADQGDDEAAADSAHEGGGDDDGGEAAT